MADAKPVSTPMSTMTALDLDEHGEAVDQREYRSMIGSLLYLTATQLDIQLITSLCACFQASPRTLHRQAVQRIFRYLKQTLKFGIWYSASSSLDLVGFLDADFAGCGIDRKNTYGTCHFLGSSLVCWFSHKQSSVAQSTTEAKYVAPASCCSQFLWIVHTIRDYRETYKSVPLMCDSSSAICLAKNPVFHGRAKYIKVRYHFLKDHIEKGDIEMKYIDTKRQLTDIFTKPFDVTHFASLQGDLVFAIPMAWFERELVFYLIYFVSFCFSFAFPSCSPKLTLLHLLY
jgi:hypothetical protein